jgi:hypothetical protein
MAQPPLWNGYIRDLETGAIVILANATPVAGGHA